MLYFRADQHVALGLQNIIWQLYYQLVGTLRDFRVP